MSLFSIFASDSPREDCNSPHRCLSIPHIACAARAQDEASRMEDAIAHTEDAAAHAPPATAHIDTVKVQTEVAIAHNVPAIVFADETTAHAAPVVIEPHFEPTATAHEKGRSHFHSKGGCSFGSACVIKQTLKTFSETGQTVLESQDNLFHFFAFFKSGKLFLKHGNRAKKIMFFSIFVFSYSLIFVLILGS